MLTHTFSMSNTSQIGATAEAFVKYKLLSWGYPVHETQEGLGYDLVVQAKGDLFKVQVKGTATTDIHNKKDTMRFHVTRRSGTKRKAYEDNAFDIVAMVDLINEHVVFLYGCHERNKRYIVDKFIKIDSRESFREAYKEANNERIRRQYKISNSGK